MTDGRETDAQSHLASLSQPRLLHHELTDPVQDSTSATDGVGRSLLILACGNDLRRDDGAGLALAQQIAQAAPPGWGEVVCICTHQLTPELAVDVARPSVGGVLFVDTRVAAAQEIDPGLAIVPLVDEPGNPRLGHHVDARMVLLYARELYAKEVAAWSVTVPGWDFDHGEGFCPPVQALLAEADGFIAQIYSEILA